MKLNSLLLAGLLCGAPLAASAQVNIGVGLNFGPARVAPPPPMIENYGASPGPGFVWVNGHWGWHGRWIWEGGHWARHPGFAWSPGHWNQSSGSWVWIEGQWVPAGPAPVPEVVIQQAPPPVIVENYGPPPGPGFFWIAGRWSWHGRWIWSRGHWDRHPHWHPGGGWIAGHWERRPGGYVWIDGRWR